MRLAVLTMGLLATASAQAQRSLFDQAPADPSAGFTATAPAPSPSLTPAPSPVPASRATPGASAAPAGGDAAADTVQPAVRPRRAAKPKPKGPTPAGSLTIANGSSNVVSAIAIEAEGKTINYDKELPPDGKAVVKLPKLKGCTVSIIATYGTEAPSPQGEVDICQNKLVKLLD